MFLYSKLTLLSRYILVFKRIIAALSRRVGASLRTRPSCCSATSQLLTANHSASVKQPVGQNIPSQSCSAVSVICVGRAHYFPGVLNVTRVILQVELKKLQYAERRRWICGPLRPTKMVSSLLKCKLFNCQLVDTLNVLCLFVLSPNGNVMYCFQLRQQQNYRG